MLLCNSLKDCLYIDQCWHAKPHESEKSTLRNCGSGIACPIYDTAICVPVGDEEDIT